MRDVEDAVPYTYLMIPKGGYMDSKAKIEKHLLEVQKPSRYIGGEVGSVIKDKSKVDVRFAFCFPDTYDIGMSHLGMKILYSLTNERENYWCERCFAPSEDFETVMRENGIPLYALESLDPIRDLTSSASRCNTSSPTRTY